MHKSKLVESPDIRPNETLLFSTAARYGLTLKDHILAQINEQDVTEPAKRIVHLILGDQPPDATAAERDMAWQFVRNLPDGVRLMKESALDRKNSVYGKADNFAGADRD